MSYARWGVDGSDVYVYASTGGGYVCCDCLRWWASGWTKTALEMVEHLEQDRAAGLTVPDYTLERLRLDGWRERLLTVLGRRLVQRVTRYRPTVWFTLD